MLTDRIAAAWQAETGCTTQEHDTVLIVLKCYDVPPQIVAQDELLFPACLLSPEHQGPVAGVIMKIALRGYPEVLVDVCSAPGVVVRYVGMELLARPRESNEVGRIEERGDMGERLWWNVEQSIGCACSLRVVM